jgi:precorrin-6B methylase 2
MTRLARLLVLLLVTPFTTADAQSQDDAADVRRLVEALEVHSGSTVCEIGAGSGALSIAMAQAVGERGHVYANELNRDRLKDVERAAERAKLTNMTVVEAGETGTNLPDGACDALFMRNVYHHFADPPTMNASLMQALKPGGRIAVVDFRPRSTEAAKPEDRDEDAHHGVGADTVAAELKAARFEVLSNDRRADRGFMVVARKP